MVDSSHWVSADYYWVIGVLLASLASFISNLGLTLQKLQHRRLKLSGASREDASRYHEHALWRVGIALVIFGSVADVTALSFSAQSLIAPLASLTLVSNVIFAPLLLDERIGAREYVATVTILLGSVLSVVYAPHEDAQLSHEQLFAAFRNTPFVLYAALIATYVLFSYLFINHMLRIEVTEGTDSPHYVRYEPVLRFAYPSLAGAAGAQSVLFAKATLELVADSYHSAAMFFYWETYVIVFLLGFSVYMQIHLLNEGLRRFQIAFVVPVFTAFWILISVTAGMIFYDEWRGMTGRQGGLFGLGVFVTVLGVALLATRAYVRDGSLESSHSHHVSQQEQQEKEQQQQQHRVQVHLDGAKALNDSTSSPSSTSSSSSSIATTWGDQLVAKAHAATRAATTTTPTPTTAAMMEDSEDEEHDHESDAERARRPLLSSAKRTAPPHRSSPTMC